MSPVSTEAQRIRKAAVGDIGGSPTVQKKIVNFLRDQLTERPLATLGVAAAIGLVLGRLVKR